jgi:hypothetical protein
VGVAFVLILFVYENMGIRVTLALLYIHHERTQKMQLMKNGLPSPYVAVPYYFNQCLAVINSGAAPHHIELQTVCADPPIFDSWSAK